MLRSRPLLMSLAPGAHALDAIVLEVRELTVAGIAVRRRERAPGRAFRPRRPGSRSRRATATLPDPVGKLSNIALVCQSPVIAEPRFGCGAGQLTGRGGPTGSIDMLIAAEMRTDTSVTTFSGSGLKVAGTTATFEGRLDDKGWQVKGSTGTTTVAALRKFAAPWFQLPADITGDGKAAIEGGASDVGCGTHAGRHAQARRRGPHQRGQHHRHRQTHRHRAAAGEPQRQPTPGCGSMSPENRARCWWIRCCSISARTRSRSTPGEP